MPNYAHDPLTVYAVGKDIRDTIIHWCLTNNVTDCKIIEIMKLSDLTSAEKHDEHFVRFLADGDGIKGTIRCVNGIYLMIWWV